MRRAYRFLLRPTSKQAQSLVEMLRDHCSLYHGVLRERRAAYRHVSKTSIRYGDQSARLTDVRVFDPQRQGRWSFSGRQATTFPRVRAGQPNRPASPCGGEGRHAASHGCAAGGEDHAHKTALAMVREYDVVAHERLSIANMVRAPQPKPDPGNAGAFLPNASRSEGRVEQEHPRRGLGGVVGRPRAQG